MMRFVEHRLGDRRVLRLIRGWLKAGVVEDGVRQPATKGTPQGAVISPLLANIYLHYAYDLWTHAMAETACARCDDRGALRRRHGRWFRAPV